MKKKILCVMCALIGGIAIFEKDLQACKIHYATSGFNNKMLKLYGFKDGEFCVDSSSPVRQLSIEERAEYGKIEEGVSVDTAEEFITAAYYSPTKIEPKSQAAIDKELPKNKEGALRLAAMWLQKATDGAQKALAIIKAKSSGVSDKEIKDYFAAYIEKEASAEGKKHLGKHYPNAAELKNAIQPLIDYYLNPTKENLKKLADTETSAKNPAAYADFIRAISGGSLNNKVNNAHKK